MDNWVQRVPQKAPKEDNEGIIPLWRAIKGGHGLVARLLWEHNAAFDSDMEGQSFSNAVGQGNGNVPEELHRCETDLLSAKTRMIPSSATTMDSLIRLTTKMSLEKFESLLSSPPTSNFSLHPNLDCKKQHKEDPCLTKQRSTADGMGEKQSWSPFKSMTERRPSKSLNFENSLFSVLSAPSRGSKGWSFAYTTHSRRVTIFEHHPRRRSGGKLISLPESLEELMRIAGKKLQIEPCKVLSMDGAEIHDLSLIRDNDHLYFPSKDFVEPSNENT
ncbi:hypothetical protein L7F22_020350 [Adiantum nelumboides]|nr:hypothetical protein [Adiantum nelumboides]